jgi:hypothetical protein
MLSSPGVYYNEENLHLPVYARNGIETTRGYIQGDQKITFPRCAGYRNDSDSNTDSQIIQPKAVNLSSHVSPKIKYEIRAFHVTNRSRNKIYVASPIS